MAWRLIGLPFASPFTAVCPACDGPIRAGDRIAREVDGDSPYRIERYCHATCTTVGEVA